MRLPRTREEMERPQFTLQTAAAIAPETLPNTIQVWLKRQVIEPAVPSKGQGHPTGLSYLNLLEIAMVEQLTSVGANDHVYLKDLLTRPGYDYRLIDILRRRKFEIVVLLPGFRRYRSRAEETAPLYFLMRPADVGDFLSTPEPNDYSAWIVVNMPQLKGKVDRKLMTMVEGAPVE